MAFIDKKDLKSLYTESKNEAHLWRADYTAFERLMNNDLMEGLDPSLPEVNDGSLAAALFKLPKRIFNSKIRGKVEAVDSDQRWLGELANLRWEKHIVPNANTQAPFVRKWKDAIRKSAGYGSVPLITLPVERNGKTFTDFIVAQPQDVTLEPGKVSDYDSDVIFWDVYYTNLQLENMIEEAKSEQTEGEDKDEDSYNKWDIPAMQAILDTGNKEERSSLDTPRQEQDRNVRPKGFKFTITYQRGANAPFYMYHQESDSTIREWTNPDPSGDVPVHFLYCYQDFINPYGIGIVKLAGGTQNVLDYMRQADVLATQLGIRPPISIGGDTSETDIDSIVYAQDAQWFTGNATVRREEMSNAVYTQLPGRISMYNASLQKLIPTGDTSASSQTSGDATQSKTPAGVHLAAANLSIDDDDFRDNLFVTYQAVAKSMINTDFANMENTEDMIVSDDERELLLKAGLDFPTNEQGEMSNKVEMVWDSLRTTFDFTVDATSGIAGDDKQDAADIMNALSTVTPQVAYYMGKDGYKFNQGEAYYNLFRKMNLENVDKIITKMSDEEAAEAQKAPFPIIDPPTIRLTGQIPNSAMGAALQSGGVQVDPNASTMQDNIDIGDILKDPTTGPNAKAQIQQLAGLQPDVIQPPAPVMPGQPTDPNAPPTASDQSQAPQPPSVPSQEEVQANVQAIMQQYGVDESTALAALAAEHQGFPPEDVIAHLQKLKGQGVPA